MEHAKVTKYLDLFHKLRKEFDVRKQKRYHKETFPKGTKEDVSLVTLEKESLHSLPAAEVLASREETIATLQDSNELVTYRVPCMIYEMHEKEEVDSSTSTLGEDHPSLLPVVGEIIAPEEETLVILQDVYEY